MGSNPIYLEQFTFSLKRRESEQSQLVVLCCLALFVSDMCVQGTEYGKLLRSS